MARDYVCLYHSYLDAMEALGDAERGRLMTAMLTYSSQGAVGELSGNEKFIWPMIRSQIDRDREAYEQKCENNRSNRKRPSTNDNERERTITNDNERERTLTNVDKEKGKGEEEGEYSPPKSPSRGGKRFSPPTVEEVKAYCDERDNGVDAQSFVDFYESKGWYVGKNRMKDWKAAVRTWERSSRGGSSRREADPYADYPTF